MNNFNPDSKPLSPFILREVRRDEINIAAQLLGRGMCDNPMNVRAFGIERSRAPITSLGAFLSAGIGRPL